MSQADFPPLSPLQHSSQIRMRFTEVRKLHQPGPSFRYLVATGGDGV